MVQDYMESQHYCQKWWLVYINRRIQSLSEGGGWFGGKSGSEVWCGGGGSLVPGLGGGGWVA